MLISAFPNWILTWPRWVKRGVAVCADSFICLFSFWLALSLRMERLLSLFELPWEAMFFAMAVAIPLFVKFGLYRAIFRHAGLNASIAIAQVMGIYTLVCVIVYTVISIPSVPRSIGVVQPLLMCLLVAISRVLARSWLGGFYLKISSGQGSVNLLIYGAGSAGRQLAAGLSVNRAMHVVGYLDDDERLVGQLLNGIRIFSADNIPNLMVKQGVSLVLLAIPSAGQVRRNEILNSLTQYKLRVRTLPPLSDLDGGYVKASDLKELDVQDLLGREPVVPHPLLVAKTVAGRVVMVTGAGGSIGSELCRQIIRTQPRTLLLVELNEYALYTIHQELVRFSDLNFEGAVEVIPLLANVRDSVRLDEILSTWKPQTVYHAAAYKHVPLVEHNPAEGVRNNVYGTHTLATQSALHGVSDFVLISTDKAVRPSNVMGASKRLAEMVLQAEAHHLAKQNKKTRFSMVRFGNVLGSSGSVVPLFRQQIQTGGPITLTHADVTRYFMTIPEAAQLVMQAGAMATGGDVFVLDMGQPVKICDLARRMVMLSGLAVKDESHPGGDIEIQITGLRPGEKLYEELLIGDNPQATNHPRIMKAHENFLAWNELQPKLDALSEALDLNDTPQILAMLKVLVPGYTPDEEVADWVWREHRKTGT